MQRFLHVSLRARVAISIALPLLAVMTAFSFLQYYRETQLIQTQLEGDARFVGDVMVSQLTYAMSLNNKDMIASMVKDATLLSDIQRVIILDPNGFVRFDSAETGNEAGLRLDPHSGSCSFCHQHDPGALPRTNILRVAGRDALQIAAPIENGPSCYQCHDSSQQNVGVLLVDVSAQEQQRLARQNAFINLGLSILVTAILSGAIYFLLNWLVTRRINAFMEPLSAYANGNYDVRLPVSKTGDELDNLAVTFNDMIVEIESHIQEESKRGELLRNTVIAERERIARELHDSLPQLLAYLNTKIGAIYLYVENENKPEALENLRQLENASHHLLMDVRDAIHGLRASRLLDSGLAPAIQNYIEQFKELCSIPVTFTHDPILDTLRPDPEIEVQALRIVQEALSNVRKHARAATASVEMLFKEGQVVLVIKDNGIGFNPESLLADGKSHYGMQTMRERAECNGGKFMIKSQPGEGVTITVSLPLRIES